MVWILSSVLPFLVLIIGVSSVQTTFRHYELVSEEVHSTRLSLQWSVLGPFAAGMRESQFGALAPLAFDNLQHIFSASRESCYETPYLSRGCAQVKTIEAVGFQQASLHTQEVRIVYPEADWEGVARTIGWAGTQWQSLCMVDLTVGSSRSEVVQNTTLRLAVSGAASFTVVHEDDLGHDHSLRDLTWYNGDWYGYTKRSNGSILTPAHHITLPRGHYKLIVKAVREVRIHGNGVGEDGPDINFTVNVETVDLNKSLIRTIQSPPYLVVPDVVDGRIAGWGIGFGVQNLDTEWWTISTCKILGLGRKYVEISSSLINSSLAPGQVRPLKVHLSQKRLIPRSLKTLEIEFNAHRSSQSGKIVTSRMNISLQHATLHVEPNIPVTYTFTYLDFDDTLQYAIAMPPANVSRTCNGRPTPMTLYLHGAGVEIRDRDSHQVLSRQLESWVILPSGRTPWGYDWQGLSRLSVDYAAQTFQENMYGIAPDELSNRRVCTPSAKQVMLVGHSNGGQGVYHFASHFPDRTFGAIVGAGYLRVADYVPFIWQRGRHFLDGSFDEVLRAALNVYENNLHASNLAGLPLFLKHGSADDNVPTWHSREMYGLIQDWNRDSLSGANLVNFTEIQSRGHFWDEFMKEEDVQQMLDSRVLETKNPAYEPPLPIRSFTYVVANPDESGSKQGWSILRLAVPGRVATLQVHYVDQYSVHVFTNNVESFALPSPNASSMVTPVRVTIDGEPLTVLQKDAKTEPNRRLVLCKRDNVWVPKQPSELLADRPLGPMIRFLQTSGPLILVVPRILCDSRITEHYLSIAERFATDSYLYGAIDSRILFDDQVQHYIEAGSAHSLGNGNVLLLGGPSTNLVSFHSTAQQGVFHFIDGSDQFTVRNNIFSQNATLLALVPSPIPRSTRTERNLKRSALLLHGTDRHSVERGAALLPLLTASMIPEWIVVNSKAQWKGSGGLLAAGWYNYSWDWSEAMSAEQ